MNYYEHCKGFIRNLKKQYFKSNIQKDIKAVLDIKENVWKNWNLTIEEKKEVLKEIGIIE